MSDRPRILFLCTELAGYFVRGICRLRDQHDVDIRIFSYPVHRNAPFTFDLEGIVMMDRDILAQGSTMEEIRQWGPDLIYVAGWADKTYNRLARHYRQLGVPVVAGLDNPWTGSARQYLACLLSPVFIRPLYSHVWVAGLRQYEYARRLGFKPNRIFPGLYVADTELFGMNTGGTQQKVLVYVGRLEKVKGVDILHSAFSQLTDVERKGWTLVLVGNGSLRSQLTPSATVRIVDFQQPDALQGLISDAGGMILPSLYEPWGVVVHEMAAAGKPLLLSDKVNSHEAFLVHGYNGYLFESGSVDILKETLIRFFRMPDDERSKQGQRSRQLARTIEPAVWPARLLQMIQNESNGPL